LRLKNLSSNMNFEMKMPDLATTGSAMTLIKWLIQPGELVKRGQMLLEVETDKAAMEVESTANGILRETRFNAGDQISAGDIIAVIETAAAVAPKATAAPVVAPTPTTSIGAAPAATAPKKAGGMFARNREAASPTVPTAAVVPPPTGAIPLSVARRAAARRLQQSKQTIPHFYLQTSANAGAMIARRQAALPDKLVWDAFFVHAAARVLPQFPELASRFENDSLLPATTTAIGVAADIEGDLYVIPVEKPVGKTVPELSREIRAAADALRQNEPGSRKNQPGLLTITNLGGANVETFTAIINPPEAAILAIGKIQPVVVPRSENGFAIEQRVNLTLSVDHRVVSGKYAADFLGALVKEIEKL
jgi:pyruvate dehydrogenase E2 component (dihydrolipoamide acetyltransferase)